jgi:hypothetical protein
VQVLDFQCQQHRLFPQLATAYATTIASQQIYDFYRQASANIDKGDLSQLPLVRSL